MNRMLPALLKLLLVLAAVSHGTATSCNISETKTFVQCYGALGQSVFIYPFNTSSEIVNLEVSFQGTQFFRYKDKTGPVDEACQNRCQLMTNGTLRLDNIMKSDSGIYTIEEFDKEGKIRQKKNITLTIQGLGAPVMCTLGNGTEIVVRMNASLSASSLLNNTEILFWAGGAEMVSTVCKSRLHTPKNTSDISQQTPATCGEGLFSNDNVLMTKESSGNIVLPAVLGVCLSLMVLLLGTCYLYKKQKKTKTIQRSKGDRCEDPQELVYCQVQVVKKKQGPKKQEQEPQVVYGEVKVSNDSKAVRHSPNEQTDTIYSGIRT